ncbi:hypothetical protein BU23DRAFT_516338, partial [Bimuria novae-zelandiae CBS 107.79]
MNSAPTIRQSMAPPTDADFTPLQEHQEQTPSTFYGAKPVLYSHHTGLTLIASKTKLRSEPLFEGLHTELEGADEGDVLVRDIEVWVSSEHFTVFQMTPAKVGVHIPYPKIALHGLCQSKGVDALLMNVYLNDPETVNSAEDIDVLEMVLLPPQFDRQDPQTACIKEIFQALNTCADMHPDMYDDEGQEPDFSAPGASGWITAENMDEYVDEEGNFVGTVIGEELGPGAGTVREREEEGEEGEGVNGVNGHEEKYQRT